MSLALIVNQIKEMAIYKHFDPASFTVLVMAVIQLVEKTQQGGQQKKDLAIEVVKEVIKDIPMSEADRAIVQASVDTLLPGLIDGIVAAGNGQLFEKAERGLKACFTFCFSHK